MRPPVFFYDGGDISRILNTLYYSQFLPISEITYDGVTIPDTNMNVCIKDNYRGLLPAKFGNVQLDKTDTWLYQLFGIPGGPILTDDTHYQCNNDEFEGVTLEDFPSVPPVSDDEYTDEEILALCTAQGQGINWNAIVVDCPKLSHYRLFQQSNEPRQNPTTGFIYEPSTPLFSDYTSKYRFIHIPPGLSADYRSEGTLAFPVGTVITKTFAIPANLNQPEVDESILETRLLIHRESGWHGISYQWSVEKNDATLVLGGAKVNIEFIDQEGNIQQTRYSIPNANQCSSCHRTNNQLLPIGTKARLLNHQHPTQQDNQLILMSRAGLLNNLPDIHQVARTPMWDDPNDGSLEDRAKAYLDVNCAHCHRPGGRAWSTGLLLDESNSIGRSYGLCKPPVAAGSGAGNLRFAIVPGRPEESILVYRLQSIDPSVRMPELGRSLIHNKANELIFDWISQLEGSCTEP